MVNLPQSLDVEIVPGRFAQGTLASFQPNGGQPDPDGNFAFAAGDQALLKIKNNSSGPLYVSVLNFTPDGAVKVHYPYAAEAQKKLSPGQTLHVDCAFDGGSGQEGFKVIGTSQEIDLLFLETQGKERSAAQPESTLKSPFGQLMGSVMSGTRASRPSIKEPSQYVAKEILWVNLK